MTLVDAPPIIIIGQFPPPVTGFAFITQQMARLTSERYVTTTVDLSPHRKRGGAGYHGERLLLTLRGLIPLLRGSLNNRERICYIACESRLGLIYTIILSAAARLLGYRLYLHHHNFNYIDSPSRLMALLVAAAGAKATHIFLCDTMAGQFARRYSSAVHTVIISNSAFVEMTGNPYTPAIKKPGDPLVIGLLSNLNNDKGLRIFLDLLRVAVGDGMNIRGVLAGPPDGEAERHIIEEAESELGETLSYRGALYGEAKQEFFRGLDLFVFPTRYANEAQPTVIFEALACGVPVLSYDRGCIASQVGSCGAVQARDEDFVQFALKKLKEYSSRPDTLSRLKSDSHAVFLSDREQSLHKAKTLFEAI